MNVAGANSDYINSQCAFCFQNPTNGAWIKAWPPGQQNACSGTVYGASVKWDIACGQDPAPVYIPGGEGGATRILEMNVESSPFTGACLEGNCEGTIGPVSPAGTMTVWTGTACLTPPEG
jgi:hypothetical protein